MKNQFDQKSEDQDRKDLIAAFQQEFIPKSHFDEWLPVYRIASAVRLLLQAISLVLALALVAYPGKYFFGSWLIGLAPAIFLLYFLEKVKRQSADIGLRRYFAEKRVPAFVLAVALLASGASVVSSVFGAPLFVAEIMPPPSTISVDSIQAAGKEEKSAATAFWEPQIDSANHKANLVFSQGNHKGKISGRTKTQKYKHENRAAGFQQELNAALLAIEASTKQKVDQAKAENEAIFARADQQTAFVGFWTGVGCLGLEILFYLISFFQIRFRFKSVQQLIDRRDKSSKIADAILAAEEDQDPPRDPSGGGGKKQGKEQKTESEQLAEIEALFPGFADRFGDALNKAKQNSQTSAQARQQSQTKTKQSAEVSIPTDAEQKNKNRTETKQETKTVILNKDINHGSVTVRNGEKVLYYITNKGKKTESVRYYSGGDIDGMINTYQKRLFEAQKAKSLKRIATNKNALQKWQAFSEKLNAYNPEVV